MDTFTRVWYSKPLVAMREPSLWRRSQRKLNQEYRFLQLPSFTDYTAVRLTVNQDGDGVVTAKVCGGAGRVAYYKPYALVETRIFPVTKPQVQAFLGRLETAQFWKIPERVPRRGFDGAEWLLEGVKQGHYHLVDRWEPEDTHYRDAALYLVGLAKLHLREG